MIDRQVPELVRGWVASAGGVITPARLAAACGSSTVSARNYLSRLARDGVVTRIARGEYIVLEAMELKPVFHDDIIKMHEHVKAVAPHLSFITWSLSWFPNLFHDVPVKQFIFIEVEDREDLAAMRERLFECDLESVIEPASKDFAAFPYKKVYPIILLKRRTRYGCQVVDGIDTAILERCIIDTYYHITRHDMPFPLESFKHVLENAIAAAAINFSFTSRYARMRNVDFEFDMILSALRPGQLERVANAPLTRIKAFNNVMTALFGQGWMERVVS